MIRSPHFTFLQKVQALQKDITFDKIIDLGFVLIGYSKDDASTFWNTTFVGSPLDTAQIKRAEEEFHSLKRQPSFYVEECGELKDFVELLTGTGYTKDYEDSYQFWAQGKPKASVVKIIEVDSDEKLKTYLQILDTCYQKDDPQNPYGELGDYLNVAESAWRKHHDSGKIQYFISYKDEQPVAVSTLTSHGGLGYISNVGSLREVRGEGFGKAATLHAIAESFNNKNSQHFLVTEEGDYPHRFYQQIGFEPRFNVTGFTKKS